MIGLVIGIISVIVVMQVFRLSEGSKRTTIGGNDAQTSGALALTTLQRDIRQAGYGLSSFGVIGCNLSPTPPRIWTIPLIAPVTINKVGIPAGDANTDTLTIAFGNGAGASEGDLVLSQSLGPTIYTVATPTSFAVGDWVAAVRNPRTEPCTVTLESVTATNAFSATVGAGVTGMTDGTLFNLGTAPQVHVYAIRNGQLTVCDYLTNNCSVPGNVGNPDVWVPIGDNITSLRAQYGRDTTAPTTDAVVNLYDQETPTTSEACGWGRIVALRLAIAARSSQFDANDGAPVTLAPSPDWAGGADTPINLSLRPDGKLNPDWAQFRYKTFETTVPLRNLLWQGGKTCP